MQLVLGKKNKKTNTLEINEYKCLPNFELKLKFLLISQTGRHIVDRDLQFDGHCDGLKYIFSAVETHSNVSYVFIVMTFDDVTRSLTQIPLCSLIGQKI